MPLSSYAQKSLATPQPGSSSTGKSLSAYAAETTPVVDAQNYQTAFENPTPVAPSLIQNVGANVLSGLQDVWSAPAPQKVPVTAQSYLSDIYGTPTKDGVTGGIVGDTVNAWETALTQFQAGSKLPTVGGRALALTQAGLDAVGAFFQPISTVFNEAATVPGDIGDVANFVNKIFSSVGVVGGGTLSALVQSAPFLSEDQKNELSPIANQLGALGAQVVVGKGGADTFEALRATTHSFISKISEDSRIQQLNDNPTIQAAIQKQTAPNPEKQLPVTSETPEESPVALADKTPIGQQPMPQPFKPIKLPNASLSDYARGNGYEPYTPHEDLPSIQLGKGAKSDLPTIQTKLRSNVTDLGGGLKLVPDVPEKPVPSIKQNETAPLVPPVKQTEVPSIASSVKQTEVPSIKQTETLPSVKQTEVASQQEPVSLPREIAANGETVTKAASDINANLVKQGVEALTPEQLSTYQAGSYKGSDVKVAQMMTDDVEAVKEMARTGKNIPQEVYPQILFNAIEALATKEGDVELLQDLANSPLGTELSQAAGTMGSHGYNDNPNSVVKQLRRANVAKIGGDEGAAKIKTEAQVLKTKVSKMTVSMIKYDDIIDAITC